MIFDEPVVQVHEDVDVLAPKKPPKWCQDLGKHAGGLLSVIRKNLDVKIGIF